MNQKVRRRLMMQSGVPVEERIYKGTVDCAKKVFEAEGELLINFNQKY